MKKIRFNLSNEITIEDLIGRLGLGGEDSWNMFQISSLAFTDTFKNGYVLLLDEVNLEQKNLFCNLWKYPLTLKR